MLETDLAVTGPGGRIVLFGNAGGGERGPLPPAGRLMGGNLAIGGFRRRSSSGTILMPARPHTRGRTGKIPIDGGHRSRQPGHMSVLEMRGVSRTYGQGASEVHALYDVDLTVHAGEMVAVMGPSGSGKSTLLTIAGALEDATSGEVRVAGQDLSRLSGNGRARLRRRSIGYVFQDYNLLPGLTAAENVTLPLELDGVSMRRALLAALRALEELGLAGRAGHYPDQLSGGERQRVALARAVVGEHQLLLADEPSGALDSANGESVMRLILDACARGMAAVVVTHDARLASLAHRVVSIKDGRISGETRPDGLVAESRAGAER
jgi:putative ABC transport system ATP-binding protein